MVSYVVGMMMHAHTINADVADIRNHPYTTSTHPVSPRIGVDQGSCGACPAPATAVPHFAWLGAAPAGWPWRPGCTGGAAGEAWSPAGDAGSARTGKRHKAVCISDPSLP